MKMYFSLSCSLVLALILIFNWNEVGEAKAITQHVDTVHHKKDGVIKKRLPQTRQLNCLSILANYPKDCNDTVLDYYSDILSILSQSDFNLTVLNNLYKKVCASRCIDPLLNVYDCLNFFDNTFFKTFIKENACRMHNGDFCHVLYLRRFLENEEYLENLTKTCPFPLTVLNCAAANSECRGYVSRFISNMGCCTIPYIGDVRSCLSNMSEPCPQYQTGSANYSTSPALWCLLIAAISAVFFSQKETKFS